MGVAEAGAALRPRVEAAGRCVDGYERGVEPLAQRVYASLDVLWWWAGLNICVPESGDACIGSWFHSLSFVRFKARPTGREQEARRNTQRKVASL